MSIFTVATIIVLVNVGINVYLFSIAKNHEQRKMADVRMTVWAAASLIVMVLRWMK
jgi:ABC-type Na+ efflux pump permease subunit